MSKQVIQYAYIAVYRKSLDLVRNRRAGGMVSDLDVAQAETILKTAEAQVPDIAAAERRMAAANANIGVATAAFFPTVKLLIRAVQYRRSKKLKSPQ